MSQIDASQGLGANALVHLQTDSILSREVAMLHRQPLVPELVVLDFAKSLSFWTGLIGFDILYDRPEDKFAYLDLHGAQVMLEELDDEARWLTGDVEPPLGRGINFSITLPSIQPARQRLLDAGWALFMDEEEKWYRSRDREIGLRQFLVQDPDGYLLRLTSDLGTRPLGFGGINS
ncbi:bleomycin resistance protein [Burkholderia aenigmatica]|uniref:bleomycin resistance protein n=1 Tax=Burkholderia aenigmatica TaxID=2015348 RepID=UPI001F1D8EA9|nr:VOC family protein [Burkholderia aenigmatica]